MKVNLDLAEIKRYLRYDGDILDNITKENINKAIMLVESNAELKYIYNKYPLIIDENNVVVEKTTLILNSKSLVKHLEKCDEVILLVATLGLSLDNLIKRLEITDIGLAYIVNAVAVEYLEKSLDNIQSKIISNKNMTSRFSIGYGDLNIEYQDDFIKVLDATKKIGVNVLETHLMVPSKSVSAIIGLSKELVSNDLKKCDNCLDNGKCSGRCIGKDR